MIENVHYPPSSRVTIVSSVPIDRYNKHFTGRLVSQEDWIAVQSHRLPPATALKKELAENNC